MKDENKHTELKLIFLCVNIIANGNIELLTKAFKFFILAKCSVNLNLTLLSDCPI